MADLNRGWADVRSDASPHGFVGYLLRLLPVPLVAVDGYGRLRMPDPDSNHLSVSEDSQLECAKIADLLLLRIPLAQKEIFANAPKKAVSRPLSSEFGVAVSPKLINMRVTMTVDLFRKF